MHTRDVFKLLVLLNVFLQPGLGNRDNRRSDKAKVKVQKKSASSPSFDLSHFDIERQREWEKRSFQYDTIFTGQHEMWYTSNKVVLHPKRSGVRGASAIIDETHRLLMCTIPKIGSSTWRKFMLYLTFPNLDEAHGKRYYFETFGVKRPDFHNISKNGLKLMAVQHPTTALEYYNDPSLLKVLHSRNPVTRLLSAWLSKNAESRDPKPFAMRFPTFGDFVQNLEESSVDLRKADGHIRFQHTFCDFDRGAHYDVILKFENRKIWGNLLLKYAQVENESMFQDMVNVSQRHFMGADVFKVILKHYTLKTLAIVKRLYAKDIQLFDYSDDVQFLENAIRISSTTSSK